MSKQSKPSESGMAVVWCIAQPMIVAGLGAHLVIVGLAEIVSPVPLMLALISTLLFAAISYVFANRVSVASQKSERPISQNLIAGGLIFIVYGFGVWLIGLLFDTGAVFYCEPLVPWRIEIALFGSTAVGWLTEMAAGSHRRAAAFPLAMVAFLWIAPFYGFFSAPLFLGINLSSMCADRPLATVVLVALGMLLGKQVGHTVARWTQLTKN